jgi:hypothetical protein
MAGGAANVIAGTADDEKADLIVVRTTVMVTSPVA